MERNGTMTVDKTYASIAERRERERPAFARKGIITFGAITLLIIFFIGEVSLQKLMIIHAWSEQHLATTYCSSPIHVQQFELSSSPPSEKLLLTGPTVQEAYENKTFYVSNLTSQPQPPGESFKTIIEPNRNIFQYGLTVIRNVCMRPDGPIVMVGISEEDILAQVSEVPAVKREWFSSYNCTPNNDCVGFENVDTVPADVRWVSGTTTHIISYIENVFHHFGDRLWPHIVGFQYPLNETTPHPMDHILVHKFSTWMFQAGNNMARNTLMYMIRILGELAPRADFLVMEGLGEQDLVCYERLVLTCNTCDRLGAKLGYNITTPAFIRYRNAVFSFFGIKEPAVSLPPRPLRVAFYGRADTTRRRVANCPEVVAHLRNYTNPPFEVTDIDDLLANGVYSQTMPEVLSLFSQTDIFITVHGANTWAALLMPKHAAVIEMYGPCGPGTWLGTMTVALELKHDVSNPWGKAVPSELAGNTVECVDSIKTPDFTVDLEKLDAAIHGLALPTFGSDCRIPRHWLHRWLPS